MSSWWGKDDTRDPREGREKGAKITTKLIKGKTSITKNKTSSNIGSRSRCRDAEYGRTIDLAGNSARNTAKNRDWNYASMDLISAAQTMHPADTYSLGVSLPPAWPDTHTRTAPRGYKFIRVGTIRTPHCPHHLSRNIIFRIILQEAQHW